jgi:hypothetical protein
MGFLNDNTAFAAFFLSATGGLQGDAGMLRQLQDGFRTVCSNGRFKG